MNRKQISIEESIENRFSERLRRDNEIGHYLDVFLWLAREPDRLTNDNHRNLVITKLNWLRENYHEIFWRQKAIMDALERYEHAPIFQVRIVARQLRTGCTLDEALEWAAK